MDTHNQTPDAYVSLDGMALLWICTILFVPAIFGVMFLPHTYALLILVAGIVLAIVGPILYHRLQKPRGQH